jgi:hypothetical protein
MGYVSHRKLFNSVREKTPINSVRDPEVSYEFPETRLVFGWVWQNVVAVVTNSGKILRSVLKTGTFETVSETAISQDLRNIEYFALRQNLLIYNPFCDEQTIASNLCCEFGNEKLFCPNPCELCISDRTVCHADTPIVSIAGNVTFQVVIFATIDGKVQFRGSRKGREIATVPLNDIIDSILITEKWGFVLLHSSSNLYLYNVNGKKIKEVRSHAAILKWTTFSSPYGFDFVAMVQTTGDVTVFEAFYPERVIISVARDCWDILAIGFDSASERLILVTETGSFRAIPFVFPTPHIDC